MARSRYRGFSIRARPYQLHQSRSWTADLVISRHGHGQPVGLEQHFDTEEEAEERCVRLARRIIDGKEPGWSVDHLRSQSRLSRSVTRSQGGFMRPMLLIGIVIACLGAFMLFRGASFVKKKDVLKVGDIKVTADERQSIPPWVGGVVLVLGAGLVVAGARKRG